MVKLSDYIFQFLGKKGVSHAFMLPGGGAMHLDDSLGKSGMAYTCFLHEQAVAIAAEAFGQHANRPALLLVTSGPGATNAITGVTAGWIDSTPMLVISGQSKRPDLVGDKGVRQMGSQEVQIIPMAEGITKYAVQVLEPRDIRYHLERAYAEATTGRPGPVWLDIPLDVQAAMVEEDSLEGYVPEPKQQPDITKEVETAVRLLETSKKPLVLAGNGVKLAGAEGLLYRLLDALQLPVQTTWKAIDMIGEEHPLYAGHPGIMGDRGANKVLQSADFLLSVGSRLDTSITAFNDRNFAKNAKKVIVDIDPNEIARMDMEKEVSVACDAGFFLEELLKAVQDKKESFWNSKRKEEWKTWITYCKEIRERYPVVTDTHKHIKSFVSAYYFIGELCRLLDKEDIIVPESSGGAGEITYQAFQLKYGQKMKNAAGLGSMGFGLPYAIGSCIANGGKRTVLINGDGAFQLNIQELETLHRLGLPVKIFVWANQGYASIRSMQRNNFGGNYVASDAASGLTMPDISRVAEAYGFLVYKIRDNQELDRMLPKIMADNRPMLCELMVLPEETITPRVKATIGEDGKMVSGALEEMWPYEEGKDGA